LELRKKFDVVVGTDIFKPGMDDWKKEGVSLVLADRASCMRPSVFDLVVFNPPYLKGKTGDDAVDGGEDLGVPLRFLEDAMRAVKGTGTVVFLLNDDTDTESLRAICRKSGFGLEQVASRRVFFEELSIFVAHSRKDNGEGAGPSVLGPLENRVLQQSSRDH
jgi:methylase of polypeptide subunit release factors